jgi:crossover junction endodeoxyribonuclease RusA
MGDAGMSDGYDAVADGRKSYDLAVELKRQRGDAHWPNPAVIAIYLPWPSRDLNPNSRPHWAKRARAAKKARQDAATMAKHAGLGVIEADRLTVTAIFTPPDNRPRDEDNMIANIKSYLDGIADVVGINDSKWTLNHRRLPARPLGNVRIEIEVAA